jgi:hypothetical protein
VEALHLVCGARRPQLKRNPLGSACHHMILPWIVALATVAGAISVRLRIRPPSGLPLRRIPLRSGWRYGYLVAAGGILALAADPIFSSIRHLSVRAIQGDVVLLLFGISMAYMFWHGYRFSSAVVTAEGLFVYPMTLFWRDVTAVQESTWGIRVRAKPGQARDILILRSLYRLGVDDLHFLQELLSSAA